MDNGFIQIAAKARDNFRQVGKLIADIPEAVKDEVLRSVGGYLITQLTIYPPYKKVTRKEAFGSSFFTDKQRRFFFWALREGIIEVPYKRTFSFSDAWDMERRPGEVEISNPTSYGPFLMDPEKQSRLQGLIGWEKIDDLIKDRQPRMVEIAAAAVKRALKRLARGG